MTVDYSVFSNRLQKMNKHFGKWARRQGITCFRVYDCDVPQFPFTVDKYENYLYVNEYKTSYPMTTEDYTAWLETCLQCVADVFEVPLKNVFLKLRVQQKGIQQYEKEGAELQQHAVTEHGLKFIINLSDYLDTGLFLDHRNTRKMVFDTAKDKRVLNLFAYTGSFSVYAAAAGASKITTIDLSNTYLDWAKANFKLNKLHITNKYEFVQADVKAWLAVPPANAMYDIIILDPPTFSNSKRMDDVLDIQRDYDTLLKQCLTILAPQGVIYFSTNFRKFVMDEGAVYRSTVKNITHLSIPDDFKDKKIHRCYEIRHR